MFKLQSELDRLENLVKDLQAKRRAMYKPGGLPQKEFEDCNRVFDELLEAEIQLGMTKIKIENYERQ